jgi:hypothetical protein
MIDKEDYSKLKTAVDELGASFRKRAYGYTLNDLYTVSELLKSKKISADDLPKALSNIEARDKVFIIMSPHGSISLGIGSGRGTCYSNIEAAEKDLEATNKWSKARGQGTFEIVTLDIKKEY